MDRLLKWVKDIRQATFFDIQNVADYYFSYQAEEKWKNDQFTIAPPFDFLATRYTLPDTMPGEYRGLEILTTFRVVNFAPVSKLDDIILGDVDLNPYAPALVPMARWHILAQLFSAEGRQVSPPADWFFGIDDRGQIATYRNHPACWVVDTHTPEGTVGIIPDSFIQVSLLALTFLNCKNVKVLNPPGPSKKRLPRKVKFESRYHRLKVNAIGQRRSARQTGEKSGISQGLHIVRGHFRIYGQDNRGLLFGKYAGRFWIVSHLKGDLDSGAIAKDYEVIAPEEE